MDQGTSHEKFLVEVNGKTYECRPIDRGGSTLYQINFNSSYLYLTVATDRDGQNFWTSIPADRKLSHIVKELSEKIENHYK
jgi:hypothetical protein